MRLLVRILIPVHRPTFQLRAPLPRDPFGRTRSLRGHLRLRGHLLLRGRDLGRVAEERAGQQPGGELAALSQLGLFNPGLLTEQMANYLREARVRICWTPGANVVGRDVEDECLEVVSHLANPTGRVLSAEEQEALNAIEDAGGDVEGVIDGLNASGGLQR